MNQNIEKRTQDIIVLLSLVGSLSVLLAGGCYLFLSEQHLIPLAGRWGMLGIKVLFYSFGYPAFYLCTSIMVLGFYLKNSLAQDKSWPKVTPRVLTELGVEAGALVSLSSYLTIIEYYREASLMHQLPYGWGGRIGQLVGGQLYELFGLFGALIILTSVVMIIGIMMGRFRLAVVLEAYDTAKFKMKESMSATKVKINERVFERKLKRETKNSPVSE